jgi:DnaJ-class molecular chaperone
MTAGMVLLLSRKRPDLLVKMKVLTPNELAAETLEVSRTSEVSESRSRR